MSNLSLFVGLDYHQRFAQVLCGGCERDCVDELKVCQLAVALVETVSAFSHGASVAAAVESCCGAADLAEK